VDSRPHPEVEMQEQRRSRRSPHSAMCPCAMWRCRLRRITVPQPQATSSGQTVRNRQTPSVVNHLPLPPPSVCIRVFKSGKCVPPIPRTCSCFEAHALLDLESLSRRLRGRERIDRWSLFGRVPVCIAASNRIVGPGTEDVSSPALPGPQSASGTPASTVSRGDADVHLRMSPERNRPLVSVVIPCFNQSRFLETSIQSVRRQTYRPLEVIVVDDGSTDATSEVAGLQSATMVIRQSNRGTGAARNAGLAAARGEFVVFLDADDELLPDAVETGVTALLLHPQASCVVRYCQLMDAERRPLPTNRPQLETPNLYREWLLHNFVWTPGAVVFRRDDIASIGGFPADVSPAADYAVYLRLARGGRVILDSRDAVRYRQHDGNMSGDPVLMLRAIFEVLRRERRHVPAEYVDDFHAGLRAWRAYYCDLIVGSLRRAWREGRLGRQQLFAAWTLARHDIGALWTHITRKLTCVLSRVPPAPLECDRLAARVRHGTDIAPDPAPAGRTRPPVAVLERPEQK
jgi:glycosyltransferase involved in cell wall biosynthesis